MLQAREKSIAASINLDIELPTFPHAVLYHPAVAVPAGAAAVSEPLTEPLLTAPWIPLQVYLPSCLLE